MPGFKVNTKKAVTVLHLYSYTTSNLYMSIIGWTFLPTTVIVVYKFSPQGERMR